MVLMNPQSFPPFRSITVPSPRTLRLSFSRSSFFDLDTMLFLRVK